MFRPTLLVPIAFDHAEMKPYMTRELILAAEKFAPTRRWHVDAYLQVLISVSDLSMPADYHDFDCTIAPLAQPYLTVVIVDFFRGRATLARARPAVPCSCLPTARSCTRMLPNGSSTHCRLRFMTTPTRAYFLLLCQAHE